MFSSYGDENDKVVNKENSFENIASIPVEKCGISKMPVSVLTTEVVEGK